MERPVFTDIPSEHAQYLSKEIGPRYPNSEGEKLASSYIINWLSDQGIEFKTETFRSHHSDVHGLIIHGLLTLVAYLVFPLNQWASLMLSIFVFLSIQCYTYTWCTVSRLLPRTPATNIIAAIPPQDEARRKVILVANYDSAKSSFMFKPGLSRFFHLFYIITFLSICLIGIMGILGAGAGLAGADKSTIIRMWLGFSPFALWALVFTVLLVIGEITGEPSRGANDNASGVAIVLCLLKYFSSNPLRNTELWGVATARNSAGARGMIAFLRRHRWETKESFIINIDHVGRGEIKYLTREGMLLGFRSSNKLIKLARRISSKGGPTQIRKGSCSIKKSDALAALARSRKAISIAGMNGRTPPGWRWQGDAYDLLNRMALDTSVSFVHQMLERMDRRF